MARGAGGGAVDRDGISGGVQMRDVRVRNVVEVGNKGSRVWYDDDSFSLCRLCGKPIIESKTDGCSCGVRTLRHPPDGALPAELLLL